jgi:thiol-disulfide isomerase/thioredoxin
MKSALIIQIILLTLFAVGLAACENNSSPSLKILKGQAILELPVADVDGVKTSLPLATGKVTILNIWATWCGPCRHEMPSLDRLATSLDRQKIEVVGLSVDADDYVVREFLIERKVRFKNYIDPDMNIANNIFGIRVFPSTFVFSPKGELLEVIEGWREWDTDEMVKKMSQLANT